MFDGTNLTLINEMDQDRLMFGAHERTHFTCQIISYSMSRALMKTLPWIFRPCLEMQLEYNRNMYDPY